MKEIIFKSLKKLWLKGLTTRICMISAAGLVTGSIVTGTVLLSNNNSNPASNTASDKTFHETSHITEESDIFGDNLEANNEQNNSSEELENDTSSDSSTNNHVVSNQTAPKNEKKDDTKQNTESNTNTSQTPESNISKADIERQRKINQAYRDYITVSLPSWSVTVYRFGWAQDSTGHLAIYEYNPKETGYDNGPSDILYYDENQNTVDYWSDWREPLFNLSYCATTNHYCEFAYYDDGAYEIRLWDESFNCSESGCRKSQFTFYIDANGTYYHKFMEWGSMGYDRNDFPVHRPLTDVETCAVKHKMNECFPSSIKINAPYENNNANLDKYLPLDDAGIIQQLQNKWY